MDNISREEAIVKTPAYCFNINMIMKNCEYYKSIFDTESIYYAMKANSDSKIIKIISEQDLGFEASSIGELEILMNQGVDMKKVIFGLPIKSEEVIRKAYLMKCNKFVFDNIDELQKLKQFAPKSKKILRIFISDILERCIHYGMNFKSIIKLLNTDKYIYDIDGFSFHITINNNFDDLNMVLDRVELILKTFRRRSRKKLIFDIGGGYPTRRQEDYFNNLAKKLFLLKNKYNLEIIVEPGRSIINSAGKYVSKILLIKKFDTHYDIFIDGVESHGIFFSKNIDLIQSNNNSSKKIICRIISTTCNPVTLGLKKFPMTISVGDLIVFNNCGAYTNSMSNNFHAYEKPKILFEE